MKIERTRNAKRNIITGIAFKLVAMFGPFLMRTVLLYTLGVQYLGLNSLFTSILSFLSLTELGIGSAMVYAMYKPVARDDDPAICALLKLYRKLYRIIGTVILGLGLLLFPFIPKLVHGEVPPDINLYVLYAGYLLNTVLSYFLFGYKQSLLLAFQRNDIISTRALLLRIVMYGAQALILVLTHNYYLYVLMFLAYTVATNLANSLIVDRLFPQYSCQGQVPVQELRKIKTNVFSLIGNKLSAIMLNFADNLIISVFLGLTMVARFDNYYYVVNALVGFFTIVYEALTGGLGNSIQLETVEKNHKDFRVLSFINFWMVSWCSICFLCIIQPFITLWVGGDLMFGTGMALLFALYFYIMQSERIVLTYKDSAGIWRQDFLRPYVIIAINIGLNILTIGKIGVAGVLLATIVSLAISVPWSARTLHKHLFHMGVGRYLLRYLGWFASAAAVGAVTYLLCIQIPGSAFVQFLVRLPICAVVPNVLLLLIRAKDPDMTLAAAKLKSALLRKVQRKAKK